MDILIDNVLPFLVILTVLVFVHEMGHYLVARRNGVRVEVFSIGFGPEIFGWTDKALTRWKFSLIPLGGYVKMFGDLNVASAPDSAVAQMSLEDQNGQNDQEGEHVIDQDVHRVFPWASALVHTVAAPFLAPSEAQHE